MSFYNVTPGSPESFLLTVTFCAALVLGAVIALAHAWPWIAEVLL